jgi:chemotaxis protein histidine kinase CheA
MNSNVETKVEFNGRMEVTELWMKTIENKTRSFASQCIMACSKEYGFDASEAITKLGLENLVVIRKEMAKKSVSLKKVREVKEKKEEIPMPFAKEHVLETGCQGLCFNRGLFTQCKGKKMENGSYCKGCQSEADNSASGVPSCGTLKSRLETGLMEFRDPKGRAPTSYLRVLEKLKIPLEKAMDEALKVGKSIDDVHVAVVVKEKKSKNVLEGKRGRPKKTSQLVEASGIEDLFAKLTSDEEVVEVEEMEVVVKKSSKLSDEEKEAKKAALDAERAAKKAAADVKKAEEKAEKETARKAELEAKKAEKEAARKAELEAKKAEEKAKKEAEKKGSKEQAVPEAAPVASTGKVEVSRIQINDVMYLKSKENILYNPTTKEEVGLYDPVTKTIQALPDDQEEEYEEEE